MKQQSTKIPEMLKASWGIKIKLLIPKYLLIVVDGNKNDRNFFAKIAHTD
jgi:hypothetical protein